MAQAVFSMASLYGLVIRGNFLQFMKHAKILWYIWFGRGNFKCKFTAEEKEMKEEKTVVSASDKLE